MRTMAFCFWFFFFFEYGLLLCFFEGEVIEVHLKTLGLWTGSLVLFWCTIEMFIEKRDLNSAGVECL